VRISLTHVWVVEEEIVHPEFWKSNPAFLEKYSNGVLVCKRAGVSLVL
jgi:hypothetical protein